MRAVVVHGAGDLRVEARPDPVAGPGEVVVAMEWGGVCGSDVVLLEERRLRHRGAARPAGAWATRWPGAWSRAALA